MTNANPYDKARKPHQLGIYRYERKAWVVYTRYGWFNYMHTNPLVAVYWAVRDIKQWWRKGFGI